jgi:hypothetical protein
MGKDLLPGEKANGLRSAGTCLGRGLRSVAMMDIMRPEATARRERRDPRGIESAGRTDRFFSRREPISIFEN